MKPAANGRYLMCKSLPYYLHLLYKKYILSFCNYINDNFERLKVQVNEWREWGENYRSTWRNPPDNQPEMPVLACFCSYRNAKTNLIFFFSMIFFLNSTRRHDPSSVPARTNEAFISCLFTFISHFTQIIILIIYMNLISSNR